MLSAADRAGYEGFIAGENQLVEDLKGWGLSQRRALEMVGIAASTWHYRHRPRPGVVGPVPQSQRRYRHRLTEAEQDHIERLIRAGFCAGQSVFTSWYCALDAGDPLASMSTWYRLARRVAEADRPQRRRRRRRATAMPQFEATAPNQVWCWDITHLPGPYWGVSYQLYAIIDAFSRYVVGWRLEEAENDQMACQMFTDAITAQGQAPQIVHSDGGAAMTSKAVTRLFQHHGITASKNRPRVSNDNPFIESWFKTAKYRPDYPRWFTSIDAAHTWAATAIDTYNTTHRHSSLEGHTPTSLHHHTWPEIHHRRQATLDKLAKNHPSRWKTTTRLKTPYSAAVLNMTHTNKRLQTA